VGEDEQGLGGRSPLLGRVVGAHLVEHEDIVRGFARMDFERLLGAMLDRGLKPKIEELRTLPLIGGFLTEARVGDIKRAIQDSILEHKDALLEEIERGLEQGLDVPALVEQKVAAFPVARLETLVLDVARRELVAITWLGGLIGVLIGLGQVCYLWFLT